MEIRPARTDEELALAIDVNNAVRPRSAFTLADARSYIEAASEKKHFLAWEGGAAVGTASAAIEPQRPYPLVQILVLPEHRRRGIGSALYRAVSAWAAARGKDELEIWIDDTEPEGLAFAARRGFAEIGRKLGLELDLTAIEPPRLEPPEGIEIVTWAERPELARGIYEVAVEAYPDIPGQEEDEMESFEDWLAHDMQGSGDRPEATFVALAGEEVIGYSKFSLTEAQPTVAHHDLTGVKRAWRRRGIARVLKRAQIAWAKEAGYERLETRNEERNAPIRRLNEEFGYKPAPGRTLLRGPLRAAP